MQVWQKPAENKYLWVLRITGSNVSIYALNSKYLQTARSGQTQTKIHPKARFCSQVLHFQSQVLLVRAADRASTTAL